MRTFRFFSAVLILLFSGSAVLAQPDFKFGTAKRLLEKKVYFEEVDRRTFYCGCSYSDKKQVDADSCGYEPRKANSRSKRIEWEHIVPASRFGSPRACWQEGDDACVNSKGKAYKGRRCCAKVDAQFAAMEADLHNLVPAIGELNGDRSNYRVGDWEGEKVYGACDFKVSSSKRIFDPSDAVRGDIARAYLYMEATYGIGLSDEEKQRFESWHIADPASDWEIERNRRIIKEQGNSNSFVAPTS
ncbi:endonuclease I [Rhodobacteraceae bacterium RKSG542]|uniref:endonuclease n=1 Tax=Pseudovibrio flavus TaxID=2529854 RepID=UPI0012BB909C|nr:endonuclease [Pseudovibrio flavus]MTI17823.1 endonuclease I [Pseudovibrio flavus]